MRTNSSVSTIASFLKAKFFESIEQSTLSGIPRIGSPLTARHSQDSKNSPREYPQARLTHTPRGETSTHQKGV